jgi:hypothetical protein
MIDSSGIRPFVEEITFRSSMYSWDMTREIHREISLTIALYSFCRQLENSTNYVKDPEYPDLPRKDGAEIRKYGFVGFVQKYLNGKMPISEDEINAAFETYMESALELRGMFESGQVHRAWRNVLLQLPNVHAFEIEKCKYERDHKHDWRNHKEGVCWQIQEPIGEAVCGTALASMKSAASQIEKLHIKNVTDCHHAWADNGTLDALDLSRLHTLKIDTECSHTFFREIQVEAEARVRFNLAVTALLRKCQSNLRHLYLSSSHWRAIEWPLVNDGESHRVPPLPALESFKTLLRVTLPDFTNLLLQSRELKHIKLMNVCDGTLGDWRELWGAIRNHPSRMLLQFESLPHDPEGELLRLNHHTGEASRRKWNNDLWWDNINYSLENYLSGRRHWDRVLKNWLGNEGGESTEDEGKEYDREDKDGPGNESDGSVGSLIYWGDDN